MKYQMYIIGKHHGPAQYAFRRMSVPVHKVDGKWIPAAPPSEEHDDHINIATDLYESQVNYDPSCGPLDDIPCPDGWKVMARWWLPDDYIPKTKEQDEAERQAAIQKLKDMGVWKDDC